MRMFLTNCRRNKRALFICLMSLLLICALLTIDKELCFKIMELRRINHICKMYRNKQYSGSLCEEICSDATPFINYKCDFGKAVPFIAERNGEAIEFRRASKINDDLSWKDSSGGLILPKIDDFHHIIKLHIMINYNVTLEENMIKILINQEIDENNPKQMLNFWRLFKDNTYLMSKLFDDESIFPTIIGSCGPYYVVENLRLPKIGNIFTRNLYGLNEQELLKKLFDFIIRLDIIRPDPLKICKIDLNNFGLTTDLRLKALNADYIQIESQVNRRLASGQTCQRNEDCDWHQCRGSCDKEKHICNGIQRNDNFDVFCNYIMANLKRFTTASSITQTYQNKCLQRKFGNKPKDFGD
ncbi:divergent protein kinase domain 1C isoform X2 [Eurosta solidaginis]|uniref:divergent protein kinase domain 1C isoform X2 n=1 Tax=Eurosta solidaginis TaxID=178769 RepID=UPI00353116DB